MKAYSKANKLVYKIKNRYFKSLPEALDDVNSGADSYKNDKIEKLNKKL